MLLGVDTGGTFTDFVLLRDSQLTIHKVLSTPSAPEQAILQGIKELGLEADVNRGNVAITHGSTVATNAALEGKGVKTVYITNRGLEDILTIGRQTRRELYNLCPKPLPPPVPSELCLGTGGRLNSDGEIIDPLTNKDLNDIRMAIEEIQPQAVAINYLFSFLDDSVEKQIEAVIPNGIFTSRSSYVLPESKEYERGIATWLNAWLGPLVKTYLSNVHQKTMPSPLAVMQSSGGTIDAKQAGERAVNMLLSGPAGGLAAAKYFGEVCNQRKLLTFDMGGTSTDVSLIDGELKQTNEGHIGPYPVAVPMVDMHTIGAGGGSIAYIDEGGLLQVGPESAGASPGPACYGQGGSLPTVTDANAVLGRLRPESFLGGRMTLNIEAARNAISPLASLLQLTIEETAAGILKIANEHMTRALRMISVQKGYSPPEFHLCCFGGAGGLHACALAEALEMHSIIMPINGGVLSAFGMIIAPKERQLSAAYRHNLSLICNKDIDTHLATLSGEGRQQLEDEGIDAASIQEQASLDLCYQGQSFTLNVAWDNIVSATQSFHQAHKKRYGHELSLPIELANIRMRVYAPAEKTALPTPQASRGTPSSARKTDLYGIGESIAVWERDQIGAGEQIVGPALVTEATTTTLVAKGWTATTDQNANLFINKKPS